MANKKCKVPYFAVLLVTFAILIAGIVVTAVFGINLGFKEAGGTQIRVNLESAISTQVKPVVEDVLADNNIAIDSMFIEDKETTSYFVVNIADKSIENIDAVEAKIAAALQIDRASVSNVVVNSTIKSEVYLAIGLVIVGLIVAILLFGLFRYRVAGGLALAFTFLVQIMLPLSIVFCTRIQLSLGGIVAIIASAILMVLFAIIMLEKYRAATRGKDLNDGDEQTIMGDAVKSSAETIIFVLAALVIISVALMFVGSLASLMIGLVSLVSTIVLAFVSFMILPKTNVALGEITRLRFEAYLSKNNSPAPTKKKENNKK